MVHTREATVKSAAVEPASPAMEATKSATMKSAHSTAVETPAAPAMRPSVGEIWPAERGSTQQSSCDCQSPSYLGPAYLGPGSGFA